MRGNGAGHARFNEWKANRPGPLIAEVRRLRALARTHGLDLAVFLRAFFVRPSDGILGWSRKRIDL